MVTAKTMSRDTKVEKVDLRGITRDSDTQRTTVYLGDRYGRNENEWIICGSARLRFHDNKKQWMLAAYLNGGATDFEHDSAYALQLPLIGVIFNGCEYNHVDLTAWVDPDAVDGSWTDFHVPTSSDYNPMKHEDAMTCTEHESCKEEPHIIVPEGFYVPPYDRDLYKKVFGKRVMIRIGPAYKED